MKLLMILFLLKLYAHIKRLNLKGKVEGLLTCCRSENTTAGRRGTVNHEI